ncbi:MAG: acetyl-CoA carboxylase biotin carboxyl carrier protein subunit [Pelagibacteraceae bacterium]|nr:acetyl-CoA carboxylase biotin carboxyl carrier protein subunit [Pelagibacteraceae bacterium]MBO6483060.1 acetyl-CoA carboxylase biotin carboxyl carrier protein subunit [Pelagibacteraceae bacterium]MBO6487039.1 acetyl-CoA carboxylase biotin carboxyl carrier protein subunit [Pelagibacteraceae bacterium]|tara:strand:+ start:311 stop:718 length:408 start_codon:yes stop_codon:yes gene_type:complete
MKIDKKLIKELKDYLEEFDLSEIEYQDGDRKIKVARNKIADSSLTAHKPSLTSVKEESGTKITSPIIGTAYLSPEPGAKKFVEVGSQIKKGQTVIIVEAMKTMNHVPSTADGVVKKVLVQDGQAVEFGQTLLILK